MRSGEDFDIIIGFLGFWAVVLLVVTVWMEVTAQPALCWALGLLAMLLALYGMIRLRRRLPRPDGQPARPRQPGDSSAGQDYSAAGGRRAKHVCGQPPGFHGPLTRGHRWHGRNGRSAAATRASALRMWPPPRACPRPPYPGPSADCPGFPRPPGRRSSASPNPWATSPRPRRPGLATGRTKTIGVLAPFVSRWFFSKAIEGADRELHSRQYNLSLFNLGGHGSHRERLFSKTMVYKQIDALLVLCMALTHEEIEHLQKIDIPLVVVGGHVEECPYIGIDDYAAAATAVRHLIGLGHTDIALLHGDDETDLNFDVPRVRIQAFQDIMGEARLPVRAEWDEWGDFTVRSGQEAFRRLWAAAVPSPQQSSAPPMRWPWASSSRPTGPVCASPRTSPSSASTTTTSPRPWASPQSGSARTSRPNSAPKCCWTSSTASPAPCSPLWPRTG